MEIERTIISLTPSSGAWAIYVSEEPLDDPTDPDGWEAMPVVVWALVEERISAEDRFLDPEDDQGPKRAVKGMVAGRYGEVEYAEDGCHWDGLFVGYAYNATPDMREWADEIDVARRRFAKLMER